jgi:hypothetical protein
MEEQIILGTYVNGQPYMKHHFIEAEAQLRRNGIARTLGNFGPYIDEKKSRLPFVKIVEVCVIGPYEYTIVEAEGISLAHRLNTQREAWFQTVKEEI